MNYFAECLAKFKSLPDNTREAYGGVEAYAAVKEIEDTYNVKLSFLVILLAINELEEDDVVEYLGLKFQVKPEIAEKIKEELIDKVLDPAFEKIFDFKEGAVITASKEDIINLFSKRIIESLKSDAEVIAGLNFVIFQALNEDDSLEEKIINTLYNNDEILTSGLVASEERKVAPTVSNWLKDFIKTNGSEIFDELVLAQYLSTSANAKNLNPEEKKLLHKVLQLYRNLAFFPESMANRNVEEWQIIPVDKKDGPKLARDVLDDEGETSSARQEGKETIKAVVKPIVRPSVKKMPANEIKPEATSPLEELNKDLAQYSPDSFEYKAIAQEIARLKKKNKN